MTTQSVIPHLVVADAKAALAFYAKALGAEIVMSVPEEKGTRLLHAEMLVLGSRIYLRDDFPEYCTGKDGDVRAPAGATPVVIHLEVPDCDAATNRAREAGARVAMEPWDAFWGARYAQIVDPFGHAWSFAHPLPQNTANTPAGA